LRWRKMGLIYAPDGSQAWAKSHAMLPTPLDMGDGRLRIYVAFVDENTVGRIGYVDVDARDPSRVLEVSEAPVLDIGEPGAFDDNGVVPASVIWHGDEIWLYYVGFQLGVRVRYFMFSGLAISRDGGKTFERRQRIPVLDRRENETLVRTAPFVMRQGERWRVWYTGGDRYIDVDGKLLPTYTLRYLESEDGVNWPGPSREIMPLCNGDEFGFGRPYILCDDDGYRMWYSIRTRSVGYRLGYAESSDGIVWTRRDELADVRVSDLGWDSEMIGYASVVRVPDKLYMLYNGNDYGRTGFGLAVASCP
jgi:predicted GH43/DUF377 family glycosyl hydrolase